MLNPCNAAHLQ